MLIDMNVMFILIFPKYFKDNICLKLFTTFISKVIIRWNTTVPGVALLLYLFILTQARQDTAAGYSHFMLFVKQLLCLGGF